MTEESIKNRIKSLFKDGASVETGSTLHIGDNAKIAGRDIHVTNINVRLVELSLFKRRSSKK